MRARPAGAEGDQCEGENAPLLGLGAAFAPRKTDEAGHHVVKAKRGRR
ncbi:MAG: hypothetical protein JWP03_3723 [Phycisphaerales bacterium]|nr:hypothetical protein [Phycisphaerales bacterium]